MGAFVIAFANVTRQQWKHFLDTECGADEKAIAYIWGTDLRRSSHALVLLMNTSERDSSGVIFILSARAGNTLGEFVCPRGRDELCKSTD